MFCAGHSQGSATIGGDSGGSLTVKVQEEKAVAYKLKILVTKILKYGFEDRFSGKRYILHLWSSQFRPKELFFKPDRCIWQVRTNQNFNS